MPIKAQSVSWTFTPDEVKEILKEHFYKQEPSTRESRFEISFNIGTSYDHFERAGSANLTNVTVTVRHTNGPG
jgi:hypothetical protein